MTLNDATLAVKVTSTAQQALQATLAAIRANLPQSIVDQPVVETAVTFGTPWLDTLEAMPSDRRND